MNKRLLNAERRRKSVVRDCEFIISQVEKDGRDEMTPAEAAMMDRKKIELAELDAEIEHEREISGYNEPIVPCDFGSAVAAPYGDTMPSALPGDIRYRTEGGTIVRALKRNEPFCQRPASDGEPFVVGRAIHAWLTGRPEMAPALGAMTYGADDTSGGFMLNPVLSQMTVDLARSASVCLKAGAQTLPMPTNEVSLVRVDSDPTATWRAEGVAVPASKPTFGRITLRSKTLACIVPVTLELLEDAQNSASLIESVMSAAMGLAIDQAALGGTGAESHPLGLRNHPGVNVEAVGGVPTAYDNATNAIGAILTANYNGDIGDLTWVMHPRDATTYDALLSALEGQPQRKSPWVERLRQLYTTSISTTEGAGAESYSVVGDFTQMLIGMRSSGVIFRRLAAGTVTDSAGATYNAASQLLEHLVAHIRIDIAILRPAWFTILTGIEAA